MKTESFAILTLDRFNKCLELMVGQKNQEYSRNDDKLHNFKVAGRIKNETPEKALWGMYIKHLVSVMDMIGDLDSGKLPNIEALWEKITDSINYLMLLEGLITERLVDPVTLED